MNLVNAVTRQSTSTLFQLANKQRLRWLHKNRRPVYFEDQNHPRIIRKKFLESKDIVEVNKLMSDLLLLKDINQVDGDLLNEVSNEFLEDLNKLEITAFTQLLDLILEFEECSATYNIRNTILPHASSFSSTSSFSDSMKMLFSLSKFSKVSKRDIEIILKEVKIPSDCDDFEAVLIYFKVSQAAFDVNPLLRAKSNRSFKSLTEAIEIMNTQGVKVPMEFLKLLDASILNERIFDAIYPEIVVDKSTVIPPLDVGRDFDEIFATESKSAKAATVESEEYLNPFEIVAADKKPAMKQSSSAAVSESPEWLKSVLRRKNGKSHFIENMKFDQVKAKQDAVKGIENMKRVLRKSLLLINDPGREEATLIHRILAI
jgi:hypothetical protein